MKKLSTSIQYAAVATTLSLGAFAATPAHAVGFSGSYNPGNFTLTNTNSNGSVNTSGAPNSIVLTGSDNNSLSTGNLDYFATAVAAGTFSFDWNYTTSDATFYDPFSVLINGVAMILTNNSTATTSQSSTYATTVSLGDTIGWQVSTIDNTSGAPNVTISNFSAPAASTAVPEPFMIIGTCIGGAAALRMRKKLTDRADETNTNG
jgi:hypothetical protein